MITIPYWWDRSLESLQVTIYHNRPDLFATEPSGSPIPASPPHRTTEYKERKQNSIQSLLMLATNWDVEKDPTNWYISCYIYSNRLN